MSNAILRAVMYAFARCFDKSLSSFAAYVSDHLEDNCVDLPSSQASIHCDDGRPVSLFPLSTAIGLMCFSLLLYFLSYWANACLFRIYSLLPFITKCYYEILFLIFTTMFTAAMLWVTF